MRFGIFYEHQLPRPWNEGDELKLQQFIQNLQNFNFSQRRKHHNRFDVPRAVNARRNKTLLVRTVVVDAHPRPLG